MLNVLPCSIVFTFDYLQIACDSLSIYSSNEMEENYTVVFDTCLKLTFLCVWCPPPGRNCRFLQEMDVIQEQDENCYCYMQNRTIHLQYIWSTLQVRGHFEDHSDMQYISRELLPAKCTIS